MHQDIRSLNLAFVVWTLGTGLFIFILPLYLRDLGATSVDVGTFYAISLFVIAGSYPLGGYLISRYDSRRVIIGCWILGWCGNALYAAAFTWTAAIPAMVLNSLSAGCMPAVHLYLSERARSGERGRVFTLLYAYGSAGFVLTPWFGGYLAETMGMRWVFLLAVGIQIISTLITLRLTPLPPEQSAGEQQSTASTPLAVNPTLLQDWGREVRPYVDVLILSAAAVFFTTMAVVFAPVFLEDITALDRAAIGLLGAVASLGGALLSPILGRLGDRRGHAWAGGVGLTAFGLSALLLIALPLFPWLLLAFFFRGTTEGLRGIFGAVLSQRVEGRRRSGKAFTVFSLTGGLAAALAPYPTGWLYDANPAWPFLLAGAAAVILSLLLWLGWMGRWDFRQEPQTGV